MGENDLLNHGIEYKLIQILIKSVSKTLNGDESQDVRLN